MNAVQPNLTNPGVAAAGANVASPAGSPLERGETRYLTALTTMPGDGVAANPWPNPGLGGGSCAAGGSNNGAFFGVLQNLMGQLSAMLGQLTGTSPGTATGAQQNVADATFASTGDPHLSETGTVATATGTASTGVHFDSMTGHADLLDASGVDGGYRLSTTVTDPNAKGVTYNQSATVHLNGDRDSVTLDKDGSDSVISDGTSLALGAGESVLLSGGAPVTRNSDGSLTIGALNGSGGGIETTMAVKGSGVDVSAAVHDVTVGGDIVQQAANQSASAG